MTKLEARINSILPNDTLVIRALCFLSHSSLEISHSTSGHWVLGHWTLSNMPDERSARHRLDPLALAPADRPAIPPAPVAWCE